MSGRAIENGRIRRMVLLSRGSIPSWGNDSTLFSLAPGNVQRKSERAKIAAMMTKPTARPILSLVWSFKIQSHNVLEQHKFGYIQIFMLWNCESVGRVTGLKTCLDQRGCLQSCKKETAKRIRWGLSRVPRGIEFSCPRKLGDIAEETSVKLTKKTADDFFPDRLLMVRRQREFHRHRLATRKASPNMLVATELYFLVYNYTRPNILQPVDRRFWTTQNLSTDGCKAPRMYKMLGREW